MPCNAPTPPNCCLGVTLNSNKQHAFFFLTQKDPYHKNHLFSQPDLLKRKMLSDYKVSLLFRNMEERGVVHVLAWGPGSEAMPSVSDSIREDKGFL